MCVLNVCSNSEVAVMQLKFYIIFVLLSRNEQQMIVQRIGCFVIVIHSFCRFRLDADGSSDRLLTISLGTNGRFSSLQRFTIHCSKWAPDLQFAHAHSNKKKKKQKKKIEKGCRLLLHSDEATKLTHKSPTHFYCIGRN